MLPKFSVDSSWGVQIHTDGTGHPKSWGDSIKWSLAKWRFIVKLLKNGVNVDDNGEDTCGLCLYDMYGSETAITPTCGNCPLKKHSTQCSYDDSVYHKFFYAVNIEDRLKYANKMVSTLERIYQKHYAGKSKK